MSTMPEDYSNSSEMVSLSTYDIKLFSSLPAGSLDLNGQTEMSPHYHFIKLLILHSY